MKPIEKLNELSPHASHNIDYQTPPAEIQNDRMQIQLEVDDTEIRRRELESREALYVYS